jgi:hypothetical protein
VEIFQRQYLRLVASQQGQVVAGQSALFGVSGQQLQDEGHQGLVVLVSDHCCQLLFVGLKLLSVKSKRTAVVEAVTVFQQD